MDMADRLAQDRGSVKRPGGITVIPDAGGGGVVRMTFVGDAGTMLLVAENGRERPLRYTARIALHGRSEPTSVCPVAAGKFSAETWSGRFDSMELDGFSLPEMAPPLWLGCK